VKIHLSFFSEKSTGLQQENLFRVGNLAGVEAVLGDLSSLNLVSLLQLALTKP
jgi:hypothetical protein